jgi:hypothetical protein
VLRTLILLLSFAVIIPAFAEGDCAKNLSSPFNYRPFWIEGHAPDLEKILDVNGLLVWEVGEFFASKKRLPLEAELVKKLKTYNQKENGLLGLILKEGLVHYFNEEGAPKSLKDVLDMAIDATPQKFLQLKALITKAALTYYGAHLQPPTFQELEESTSIAEPALIEIIGDKSTFWSEAIRLNPQVYLSAKSRFTKAFLRVLQRRDYPDQLKTRASTPSLEELNMALLRGGNSASLQLDSADGKMTLDNIKIALGQAQGSGDLPDLKLFDGMAGLEQESRFQSPGAFKNFISSDLFSKDKAIATARVITEAKGFIAISVTAGIPLVEEFYQLLLKYAEDNDLPILIFPANQVFDGLDERLLNNPRIHIVTHTIENRFLRVWNRALQPKRQDPFASMNKFGQFLPGQLILVGHPQIAHMNKATGSNHIRATPFWSTGSLSQNLYPYRHSVQASTADLAKNFHTNGFLVVNKADAEAGALAEGTQNFWHVRPVYYKDDRKQGGTIGFTDMGKAYLLQDRASGKVVVQTKQDPIAIILGDWHDWNTDQQLAQAIRNVILRFPGLRDVYLHDPIDGYSHNRHEREMITVLMKKFVNGDLDYHQEMMGLVQSTNGFLDLRSNIRVIFNDSNHSYWGKQLLDKQPESQLVINGMFLTELQHAKNVLKYNDPLEYVMKGRNRYLESLPPHVKRDFDERAIPIMYPDRVKVNPFGAPDTLGPEYRPVHVNFHGHQGENGGRPSKPAHSSGSQNSVTGDSHQTSIVGGWMNVGTSTPKRVGFNDGGYSSWSNSFALVYPDGTKQLLTYDPATGTFEQRNGKSVLPPDQFFGEYPLEVRDTDNDLVPLGEVGDTHSLWLDILKKAVR